MINSNFQWPDVIPVGHRNYTSSSSILSKSISSLKLVKDDGTVIDLLHDKYPSEVERLVLICAVVGVFSGVRNSMHAGFTVAAGLNATEDLKNASANKDSPYKDCAVEIEWEAKGKAPLSISVEHLMDLTFLLSQVIIDSGGKVVTTPEKSTKGSGTRKSKDILDDISEEQIMAMLVSSGTS